MIDLHSHTNQSDGTFSPVELLAEARRVGVRILAITDHDTFAGYDLAKAAAREAGVELLCGIEVSTKLHGQTAHLLGYFLGEGDLTPLRGWLAEMQASRRERNLRLVARLRELGIDITLAEARARGCGETGRPHFAQVLVEKGYVKTVQQAFDEFLGEAGKAYVDRREPQFAAGVEKIRSAGGIASLAHPVRLRGDVAALLPEMRDAGLNAIEAYHSDHTPEDTEKFLALAKQYGMLVTGGSDFHGSVKPGLELGVGRGGNLRIPHDLVERLR
ncbi:MAG: PHP domain-containing protein [Acidobacteriota bacterium]|nr:PHP domain-containing protein [Acidobacteriota bacterium]